MKREFLDYVDDIIEEMSDIVMFTRGDGTRGLEYKA
jgi:hypothetical protein